MWASTVWSWSVADSAAFKLRRTSCVDAWMAGRRPPSGIEIGNLATIGRAAAVADIRGRLLVFIQWFSSFATRDRGARLITEPAASVARRIQAGR